MKAADLLAALEGVRRSGQGWTARCPAHADKNPSLSVREGERGLLVKCWAGCELAAICSALGIKTRQLFFDESGGVDRNASKRSQARRAGQQELRRAKGYKLDTLREAEALLTVATGLNIDSWSDAKLDFMMNRVCDAQELLLTEAMDEH